MESIVEGNEVLLFYGWWQLSVCTFAFFALLAIWWHIGRIRKDHGQVFLAASILCWSLSGLIEIYFASRPQPNIIIHEGLRSVLSLFNSLFILLALPWFKYLPSQLNTIIKSKYWNYIVGLPFIFSLLPTLSKMWTGETNSMISELDVYFAFLTLGFLASVLWTSFQKRRLPQLAYLSLFCVGITIIAQVYKLTDADINLTLFSAIFKTTLIMLFFALALSWVKELTENIIPESSRLKLKLFINKESPTKLKRIAQIDGILGLDSQPISLSPSNYDLLHRFAKSRVETEERWLEIKPKDAILGVDYDINDHNELKRLLHALYEAGAGSASIAHAAVHTKHAASEGLVALLEPFIDTVCICTMTAIVILMFNHEAAFAYGDVINNEVLIAQTGQRLGGVNLTSLAFDTAIPGFSYVLVFAVIMFAFSTMLSWSYYGLQAWKFLFGRGRMADLVYKVIFLLFTVLGAAITFDAVIKFSDAMILALVFPNMIGLLFLYPKAAEELRKYRDSMGKTKSQWSPKLQERKFK